MQSQSMRELDKALADIVAIRSHIAAGTAFRGYGPAVVAATGGLALATMLLQVIWLQDPSNYPIAFFAAWIVTALVSGAMIWIEMQARSHRHHQGLATAMILQAVEQFVPVGVAGAVLAAILWKFAPETLWMLPGLWQVLVGLGLFASIHTLPRMVAVAGAWYFVAGFAVLILSSSNQLLSPWTMGLPFVIGQFLTAALLHFASEDADAED